MSMEYSNNTVGPACAYATLSHYNNGGAPGLMASTRPAVGQVNGVYIVPTFSAPGYNTLQHGHSGGGGSCNGFFNIEKAYGQGANNCSTQYVKKLCN